jgi:putative flippase GtrA
MLLLKYILVSLAATGVDFLTYYGFGFIPIMPNTVAAVLGIACGAIVSWHLNRRWVFADVEIENEQLAQKQFFAGIALNMALNALLVYLMTDHVPLERMPLRMLAATLAWVGGYLFNRFFVFSEK